MAFQLFLECQAFNAQGFNFFRFFLAELTLQIDKIFIFFRQFVLQCFNGQINNCCQLSQLFGSRHFFHTGRHGIQGFSWCAQGQSRAVTVGNHTSWSRKRQGTDKTLIALIFQKFMLCGLQINAASEQCGKGKRHTPQNNTDTPVTGDGFLYLFDLRQHPRLIFILNQHLKILIYYVCRTTFRKALQI